MPVLRSLMRPGSPVILANTAGMAERLGEVPALEAEVVAKSDSKTGKFEQRGQFMHDDNGVIAPAHTRHVLAPCLALAAEADARTWRPSAFGVARF